MESGPMNPELIMPEPPVTIFIDGDPVVPSFRVPRGEVKMEIGNYAYKIMHPYDIVQHLGEAGKFTQAFAALDGFMRREIDIKADAAYTRIHNKHRKEGGWD